MSTSMDETTGRKALFNISLTVPSFMDAGEVKRALQTCISFGSPVITIVSGGERKITDGVIKHGKPSCWYWDIPIQVFELAATARCRNDAITCLLAWMPACSVCGNYEKDLLPDHDHVTRLIRGMLCYRCNAMEAHHEGIFELYRKVPAASLIDLFVKY
jgi:hypothetical protein